MTTTILVVVVLLTASAGLSLAQSVSCSTGSCCFPYRTSRRIQGHVCNVVISSLTMCDTNPCLSNEYCRKRNGQPQCCTVESRQFGTAFGNRGSTVNCQEKCLAPPRNSPSPSSPRCPTAIPQNRLQPQAQSQVRPTSRPNLQIIRPTRRFQLAPRPVQTTKPSPERASCPATIENGSFRRIGYVVVYRCNEGFHLVGRSTLICRASTGWSTSRPPVCVFDPSVCTFCQSTQTGETCKVELRQRDMCPNYCAGDRYCKMINDSPYCCKQVRFQLSTAFGQQSSGCRDNCIRPPRTLAGAPRDPCPKEWSCESSTEATTKPTTESPMNPTASICPLLPKPKNGAVTIENSVATYSCNEGFYVKSENTVRECKNGEWLGKPYSCYPRRECTRFPLCRVRVCVTGRVYCSRSMCPSGQYCRRKRGKKQCCKLVKRPGSKKCLKTCLNASNQG